MVAKANRWLRAARRNSCWFDWMTARANGSMPSLRSTGGGRSGSGIAISVVPVFGFFASASAMAHLVDRYPEI